MSILNRIKTQNANPPARATAPDQTNQRRPVDTDSLKSRLKTASPAGTQLPMVKAACTCVITIEECETFASQDPKKKGAEFFKIVFEVTETTDPEHVRVGGRYVWLNENTNQFDGANRMLNFCIAVSGLDPEDFEIPDDEAEFEEFYNEIAKIWGPEQDAKGAQVIMVTTLSRGGFPKASFQPVPE